MFGIGPLELLVIAAVALMLFSPKELPKMLRTVTRVWGQLRATADEFRDAIMTADGVDEFQELVKGTKAEIRKAEDSARRELMKARVEMRKAQQKLAQAAKATEDAKRKELGKPVPATPAVPTPAAASVPAPASAATRPAAAAAVLAAETVSVAAAPPGPREPAEPVGVTGSNAASSSAAHEPAVGHDQASASEATPRDVNQGAA